MDKQHYRILKLKNGESLIAGLITSDEKLTERKDVIIMDTPMIFRTISVMDNEKQGMREFLMIRSWAEYSVDKIVEIPTDTIMAILTPDDKLIGVYEFEKNKSQISPEDIDQAIQEMQDKITEDQKTKNNLHTINLELQLSPEASMSFLDLLGIGIDFEEMDEMDEEEDDEEDLDFDEEDAQQVAHPPKNKPKSKKKERPAFGNSLEDWSPDPNDYLK